MCLTADQMHDEKDLVKMEDRDRQKIFKWMHDVQRAKG